MLGYNHVANVPYIIHHIDNLDYYWIFTYCICDEQGNPLCQFIELIKKHCTALI